MSLIAKVKSVSSKQNLSKNSSGGDDYKENRDRKSTSKQAKSANLKRKSPTLSSLPPNEPSTTLADLADQTKKIKLDKAVGFSDNENQAQSCAYMSKYALNLSCGQCGRHFDLEHLKPVLLTCEKTICPDCYESPSTARVNWCDICKDNHTTSKIDNKYILQPAVIFALREISQNRFEQEHKKQLDILTDDFNKSIDRFDLIKKLKLESKSRLNEKLIAEYDDLLSRVNEAKNDYMKKYAQFQIEFDNLFTKNEEPTNSINLAFDSLDELFEQIQEAKSNESKCKSLMQTFRQQLFNANQYLNELETRCDLSMDKFTNESSSSSLLLNKMPNIKLEQLDQSSKIKCTLNYELTDNFYCLQSDMLFDYLSINENKEVLFKITDPNNEIIHQMAVSISLDSIEFRETLVEENNFFIYFSIKNKTEYLIVNFNGRELDHSLINTSRRLVHINANEIILYSEKKRLLCGLNHAQEKQYEIKEENLDLKLDKLNFKVLASNSAKMFILQDQRVKIIDKKQNAISACVNLTDEIANVLVDFDYNLLLVNEESSKIKLICWQNGHQIDELSYKHLSSNPFDRLQMTMQNKLAFIYLKPNVSIKFL